jgi:hypothetical protein
VTSMKVTLLWDVAPCSLVDTDRRFGGSYYLQCFITATSEKSSVSTGLHGATSRKTVIVKPLFSIVH